MSIPKPKTYQQWKIPTIDLLMDVITILPLARRVVPQLIGDDLLPMAPINNDIDEPFMPRHELRARWEIMLNMPDHFGTINIERTKPIIKKPKTYNHWRLKVYSIENFLDAGYIWAPYIPINL